MGNGRRGPKNVDSGTENTECSMPQADSSFSES